MPIVSDTSLSNASFSSGQPLFCISLHFKICIYTALRIKFLFIVFRQRVIAGWQPFSSHLFSLGLIEACSLSCRERWRQRCRQVSEWVCRKARGVRQHSAAASFFTMWRPSLAYSRIAYCILLFSSSFLHFHFISISPLLRIAEIIYSLLEFEEPFSLIFSFISSSSFAAE